MAHRRLNAPDGGSGGRFPNPGAPAAKIVAAQLLALASARQPVSRLIASGGGIGRSKAPVKFGQDRRAGFQGA
jgi:hypothetical protein